MAFTVKMTQRNLLILLDLFWYQYIKIDTKLVYGRSGNEIDGKEMQRRSKIVLDEVQKLIRTHGPAGRAEKKYGRRITIEVEHPALYAWLVSLKIKPGKRKRRRRHHG